MEFLLGGLYLVLCLLVAVLGRKTRAGYWGTAIIAFFATPLLVFVFLILFGRSETAI
jgi:hypothetical protein